MVYVSPLEVTVVKTRVTVNSIMEMFACLYQNNFFKKKVTHFFYMLGMEMVHFKRLSKELQFFIFTLRNMRSIHHFFSFPSAIYTI